MKNIENSLVKVARKICKMTHGLTQGLLEGRAQRGDDPYTLPMYEYCTIHPLYPIFLESGQQKMLKCELIFNPVAFFHLFYGNINGVKFSVAVSIRAIAIEPLSREKYIVYNQSIIRINIIRNHNIMQLY